MVETVEIVVATDLDGAGDAAADAPAASADETPTIGIGRGPDHCGADRDPSVRE